LSKVLWELCGDNMVVKIRFETGWGVGLGRGRRRRRRGVVF
jgi:hypothetical protein